MIVAIGNGDGLRYFPEKYFSKNQIATLLGALTGQCDFKNRTGNFINDYYEVDKAGGDRIYEIYEFHLSCNDLRFICTYRIAKEEIEFINLKIESTKIENRMIISPRRRIAN